MEAIGWAFAGPGLIILLFIFYPFFVLWEWYRYGIPPFKQRSIVQQHEINLRTGKRPLHERLFGHD